MAKKRLAFLNLDREKHHTPHILPIALACSQEPDWECVVFTQEISGEVVDRIAQQYPNHACTILTLKPAWWKQLGPRPRGTGASHFIKRLAPQLATFDAVFTPDTNMGPFLKAYPLQRPKMVYSFHGSPHRDNPFVEDVSWVDMFLLPGDKAFERRQAMGQLEGKAWAVIGYPKLELMERGTRQSMFANTRPTVLYNPHHDRQLSSWYAWGLEVLDFFVHHGNLYNLIVAPHINIKPNIPKHFSQASNILIDINSPALVDGTYLRCGDIYLGDISSQVYEFLYHPRPAIFLNPRGLDPKADPNLTPWNLGPVIDNLVSLGEVLHTQSQNNTFAGAQEDALKTTFSRGDAPPSQRAVQAIRKFLESN